MPASVPQPARVTVAACTFRRPRGLQHLLQGLAAQSVISDDNVRLDILIVDNEGSDRSRQICQAFTRAQDGIPLRYRVEPRRGISHARNAVLDNIEDDCDFVAMIDDDEVPEPDWVEQLLEAQRQSGAQVIRGPIYPVFAPDAPPWIQSQGYFGWPGRESGFHEGQSLDFASTDNTLVQWSCVRQTGLRFEPDLAFTGGEDSVFFQRLYQAGNRIAFTWKAAVHEHIPVERTRVPALLRMNYHHGVNRLKKHQYLQAAMGNDFSLLRSAAWQLGRAFASLATGLGKLASSVLRGRWSAPELLPGLMKLTRGAGLFAGLFGFSFRYYR